MLPRCAVLAIIAAGFALTGDLGWFAAHGMRVINSRTVPGADGPAHGVPSAPEGDTAGRPTPAATSRPVPPRTPDATETTPAPAPPATVADPGPRPPARGIEEARLGALRAGDRILVWLHGQAGRPGPCLACDVIDPAAGEAIVAEVAALAPNGSARLAGPPRRVAVADPGRGAGPPAIRRGGPLVVRPAGLAAAAAAESPGTVAALVVVPRGP